MICVGVFDLTRDGLSILTFVFRTVWQMFTSFEIPGTHTTPAEWALFSLSTLLSLRLIRNFLDIPQQTEE